MSIDKESPIPYYVQLVDILKNQINSGQIKSNGLIPPERELCNIFNVSRTTVRQSLQVLKEEGLIRKEKGIGTRIFNHPKFEQNLTGFYNFDLQMKAGGHVSSVILLDSQELHGPGRVQRLMGLPADTKIFKVIRLRVIDEEPIFLEKIYMPLSLFPELKAHDFKSTDVFIKKLKVKYNTELGDAKVFIEPIILDKTESEILKVVQNPPLGLMLERISYDDRGVSIAITKRIFRGDRCRHTLIIKSK